MKVLHCFLGKNKSNAANGVTQVISGLIDNWSSNDIILNGLGKTHLDSSDILVKKKNKSIITLFDGYSVKNIISILNLIKLHDVIHIHGVFSTYNLFIAAICIYAKKPFILTPHGGLNQYVFHGTNIFLKWIFHTIFQKFLIKQAYCLQALSEEEATEFVKVSRPKNLYIIPNPILFNKNDKPIEFPSIKRNSLTVGYLGRISRDKNIVPLCEAFMKFNSEEDSDNVLLMAGPIDQYHKKITTDYSDHIIKFLGPLYNEEKFLFFKSIDVLIIPSLSEGMPIVALEAMSVGTITILSRFCGFSYFNVQNAFIQCEPTYFGIQNSFKKFSRMSLEQRHMLANNSMKMIESCFSYDRVLPLYMEMYRDAYLRYNK